MKNFISLFFTFISFFPGLVFASYSISPVQLNIHKEAKIASMTVSNESEKDKHFQLTVYKRSNMSGKESYVETKDLIATPGMFKIPAGKSQLIRVAMKNAMYDQRPSAYRVAVRELPRDLLVRGSHVNLVAEFKIPISIINPENAEAVSN